MKVFRFKFFLFLLLVIVVVSAVLIGKNEWDKTKTNALTALAPLAGSQTSTDIETKGPFADPNHRSAGWTSSAYYNGCIYFLFGNLAEDNSIRCFNPSDNTWTWVQPDTEDANNQIAADGINERDNQLHLNIPGRGFLITGGAYLSESKPYYGGFFDFSSGTWTYRWGKGGASAFISPSNFPGFNAATVWSSKYNLGVVYGGVFLTGSPSRNVTLIHPNTDGTLTTEDISDQVEGTPPCLLVRNMAVAVGNWMYVYGGRCNFPDDGSNVLVDSARFHRFNLVTHVWERLDDAPFVRRMPQVTYDQQTHDIVVFGGGENVYTPSNTVMTWNVDTQGPWVDRTAEVAMPAVRMPTGAYDPITGWHCYRGGIWANAARWEPGNFNWDNVYCLRFSGSGGDSEGNTTGGDTSGNTDDGGADTAGGSGDEVGDGGVEETGSDTSDTGDVTVDEPTVVNTVTPQVIVRDIPPIRENIAPNISAKHIRFTEATTGDHRLYIVAGDWGMADSWGSSGRQDTLAYDIYLDKW